MGDPVTVAERWALEGEVLQFLSVVSWGLNTGTELLHRGYRWNCKVDMGRHLGT